MDSGRSADGARELWAVDLDNLGRGGCVWRPFPNLLPGRRVRRYRTFPGIPAAVTSARRASLASMPR